MAKEGEVYTVGFVPSYDLPDARPNSIDPFLEPLVSDIEKGFIEGKANYYIDNIIQLGANVSYMYLSLYEWVKK